MKINFDWHNYMSKDTEKKTQMPEGTRNNGKQLTWTESVHGSTFFQVSENAIKDFNYGDQGTVADKLNEMINSEEFAAVQRDFMTVMSNSMSASDFQKLKEDGFDVRSLEPEQAVTILDKIKTILAQSGTYVQGYNDNLSVEEITEITGNSGYAETIAKELSYADAPVTEENMEQIDKAVDQALTMEKPGEGSMAYMVSQKMDPTLGNLYKAAHSSINVNRSGRITGYASNAYNKQGADAAGIRKTALSQEDLQQIEKQIKNRIESDGLEVNEETLKSGKWLLEKGLPVTGENIHILQNIEGVEFPLDITQVIRQAAQAIGEGKSPFEANLNKKEESVYKQACNIYDRYQKVTFQAVDYAASNYKECNLKNIETYDPKLGYNIPQIQARKTLEEVRLKMTVEANVKLLQSGYQLETASMEDLIQKLDIAQNSLNENIWGKENAKDKAEIFSRTQKYVQELPILPVSVVGKIPFVESATLSNVVQEGRILQKQYLQMKESYETMMTPREDLGETIQKAFRNVDNILQDMDLEINESNCRAIRIMGYNQITITEENLEKIKKADKQVRNIMENLKPGITLEMIREGKNPLEMSMEDIDIYIREHEKDFINDTEKFSEFLYKLEKKKEITPSEREAYIGIYRLFRQIEKSDGAVIGSLLNQNAEMTFSNLLSAVRTKNAKHTDVVVDDNLGIVKEVNRKERSISDQIEIGIAEIRVALVAEKGKKTLDQVLKEAQELKEAKETEKEFAQMQLEDIRETADASQNQKDYLETYHQPVTLDNLYSSIVLNTKRGSTFKKVIDLEEKVSKAGFSKQEESILKEAESFLSLMDNEEIREDSYDKIISRTKQILEENIERKDLNYIDVKELQSVYKQISFAANLAKEENYEIPVQIGDEITSINLKIVHGTVGKGEVKITLETETFGKVEARFVQTGNVLEGSVLTDYMDGKKLLQAHMSSLQSALTEALKDTKTEVKSLFFGTNEKLNLNTLETPNIDKKTDISLLYKAAKEFIYYIKGIKEA